MDIFGENNLRSLILGSLSRGPKKGAVLIAEIKNIREGATKQGVYKALRALIENKIVVKYRKNLMLNQIWLNKVDKFVEQTDENYLGGGKRKKDLDTLEWMTEGSKISYVFNSWELHDKFYSHLFSLIIKKTDQQAPIYVYNPHEWFVLGVDLKENEDYLFNWLKEKKRQVYFTVGYNTALDKKFRSEYSSEESQIALDENMKFPKNYQLNIMGNFISESRSDMKFAENMHAIYENTTDYDEASKGVRKLLQKKYRLKMVISYDSQRAKKLKAKLGKNFFIPKELRNK